MRSSELDNPTDLPRGFAVGRYLILERIGGGSRGDVYAAYDPGRGRKIALKLLRIDSSVSGRAIYGLSQCLQEAQTLVRLSHPQIISVYEVGTAADRVFVAMEFIEGVTLPRWLRQQSHSQQEILDVFILAGRALAAAHAAGLVYANFKPDNVLIGYNGRVCVTDLGFAGAGAARNENAEPTQLELALGLPQASRNLHPHPLKQNADTRRPPDNIAPEQRQGKPVEFRTDIFTFCAALYEALYHVPFTKAIMSEHSADNPAGTLRLGSAAARPSSSWLRQALLRGLHAEPDKRYSSMTPLLSALSRQRQKRRRWWIGGSLGVALWGFLLFGWYVSVLAKRHELLCSGAPARLATVWDANRKAAVHAAILRTGKPYADETWQRVEKALDQYGAQWAAMHTEACQATRIRGEQSEALLDVRMQCLDRRLTDLTALTQLLLRVEPAWLVKVTKATQDLTPVGVCADVLALTAPVPPPDEPSKRTRLAVMVKNLSEVVAMQRLGQYVPAQEAALLLVQESRDLGYAPFEAEALYWLGFIQNHRGQNQPAVETLLRAASAGIAGRDLRIAAKAWSKLVSINGFNLEQPAEAQKWEAFASAAIAALGENLEAQFELASARCVAAHPQPTQDRTLALCQESLDAAIKAYGPSHYHVPAQMNNLADVLTARHQTEQGLRFYRQALQITRQQLGENHPSVAIHLNNLGEALGSLGQYREAITTLTQAVELQSRVLEPDHVERGVVLGTLGQLQWEDGQVDAASATLKNALKILEKGFPPGHSQLGSSQLKYMHVLLAQQKNLEAQQLAEKFLTLADPSQPDTAEVHYLLGQAWSRQQRYSEALAQHKEALVLHEKRNLVEGRELDRAAIGTDLIHLGRAKEALPLLEQIVRPGQTATLPADVRAISQFALAQALWQLNRSLEGERIMTLIAAARSFFADGGPKYQVEKDEVDRWLTAQHVGTIARMPQ